MIREIASRARALILGPDPGLYLITGCVALASVVLILISYGFIPAAVTAVARYLTALF